MRNVKILAYYLIQSYLLKKDKFIMPVYCFRGKFMNFSEAATGCVL